MAEAPAVDDSKVLIIERVFDVPREEVFRAWTDADCLKEWFCCKGYKVLFADIDPRVGGVWRSGMESPGGSQYVSGGVIREIQEPERLVITHAWEETNTDEEINIGHETVITIDFKELDNAKTKMFFRQEIFKTPSSRDSHSQGWSEALDNLDVYLGKA